jgi:predicted GH43/DUF377 family glycosyl hydrolase
MLRPDPKRVVIRPFEPDDEAAGLVVTPPSRAQRIADRVVALTDDDLKLELQRVTVSLAGRYNDIKGIFMRRFHGVNGLVIDHCALQNDQALLIGAYFSEEYAFEAAALLNPSIVIHPDQSGVPDGGIRFVLSLRGIGEGHISSVAFRTGIYVADGSITIDAVSPQAITPRIEYIPGGASDDPGVRLFCEESKDLSEVVIFPITPRQRHGIEDVRLVRFTDDDGHVTYYGTYTAFSGQEARQELLRTTDFATFELNALHGPATANKGMALFPRKINGRYAMLGRQDHENIWLCLSDNLYQWNDALRVVAPRWSWEFVQIGNGGSPIEIDEGWLVITHGVGAVRNYCLGACLLDKSDPTKLLARMTYPLLRPDPEERFGYVPNVTYTCGAMLSGRTLLLPYALADSFTKFATVSVDKLLAAMDRGM